jgi:hypothetical protein
MMSALGQKRKSARFERHVRSAPESRHPADRSACPLRARSRSVTLARSSAVPAAASRPARPR